MMNEKHEYIAQLIAVERDIFGVNRSCVESSIRIGTTNHFFPHEKKKQAIWGRYGGNVYPLESCSAETLSTTR